MASIELISDPLEWQEYCEMLRQSSENGGRKRNTLGFVPSMGALHQGHLSLVRRALAEQSYCLVSIFVNPAQFDDPNDLASYPSTLESDLALMQEAGVQAVFLPKAASVYPNGYRFRVSEEQVSTRFCGTHRPGHFDGVLTVVSKLLNLTQAHAAYFGLKDYQQYSLVRDMARDFFLKTAIVGCPTVREADGLAMSSRNVRLSPSQRKLAPQFYKILQNSVQTKLGVNIVSPDHVKNELTAVGFDVDYVEDLIDSTSSRRLAAIRLGPIRLIDNVELFSGPQQGDSN